MVLLELDVWLLELLLEDEALEVVDEVELEVLEALLVELLTELLIELLTLLLALLELTLEPMLELKLALELARLELLESEPLPPLHPVSTATTMLATTTAFMRST